MLAEKTSGQLINLGLNITNCRGHEYEDAAAVSEHINGLSARICKINSKMIYTHCVSHRQNLVISASCNTQDVRNVFNKIKEISSLSKFSEHWQKLLINLIDKLAPDPQK